MTLTAKESLPAIAAGAPTPHQRRRGTRRSAVISELPLVVPAVVVIGVLVAAPTLYVGYRSFFAWTPGARSPFVGVDNYVDLFASDFFRQVLVNQAVLLMGLPLYTVVPLVLALLLHERVPGAGVFRTILFFPAILSPAIVGIMFRVVLAEDGLVNSVFRSVGLDVLAQSWLSDDALVKPTLILVLTWAGLGVGVVIFAAALSALPVELMEAAVIDGANWWQRAWHVVIPELRPTIELWVSFQAIAIFAFSFGWIYVLTSGGPNGASSTLDYDIYQNALVFGFFGLAAAESVVLLGLILLLAAVAALVRRLSSSRLRGAGTR